jgi:hypothetical protein
MDIDLWPIPYIRAHPFSTMALCNIVGDFGYLGFAFDAVGFVSVAKLVGASFTMLAHIILLAYGDDQAQRITHEEGRLAKVILGLRRGAQRATTPMPDLLHQWIRAKPIGVTFSMLALNGIALVADCTVAVPHPGLKMPFQAALGILITCGTGAFATADFVKKQRVANILTKVAPTILVGASVASAGLVMTTWNPFILLSVMAFAISNVAGFFTKIDKKEPVSAGI